MKLALMQPYLFPYLGYFQLIAASDIFVIYDDVQYIKGGWINRNRILVNGAPKYITLPVEKDHLSRMINERRFATTIARDKELILRQLQAAYRQAPFFQDTMELVERCCALNESNVAAFVTESLRLCCQHIRIETPMRLSSTLAKTPGTEAAERVIEVNKLLGADHYINPAGGMELYGKDAFAKCGIVLSFLKSREITYPQFGNPFAPSLSILDVLMFNPVSVVRTLLGAYDLL